MTERQSAVGFGPKQIAIVLETVDELEVNEERDLRFEIVKNGKSEEMAIRVVKDDVDALMLYFSPLRKLPTKSIGRWSASAKSTVSNRCYRGGPGSAG